MLQKGELHRRNKHNGRYDFDKLIEVNPLLEKYVLTNKYGDLSVDFFDPKAVKALNKSLLILHYGLQYWDIPAHSLCPPIPGRADYIHYISDLVGTKNIKCLDVGVGANCIYPIVGVCQYGWDFVGSDIDLESIKNAQKIVDNNDILKGKIELRLQGDSNLIFDGIVTKDDFFDVVICNPPFHDSLESAEKGTLRKLKNLKAGKQQKLSLNFGGKSNELWCKGGEYQFISNIITQSRAYRNNCHCFTSLVSKESNLKLLYRNLNKIGVADYKTINMEQGNKISRILAWHF